MLIVARFVFQAADSVVVQMLNALTLGLMLTSVIGAVLRARAGAQEGWFFLLAWGPANLIIGARIVQFMLASPTPAWMDYLVPIGFVFASLILILVTARVARENETALAVARLSARTDPLTKLPNRASLDAALAPRERAAASAPHAIAVLFIDIDHFKAINDRHGHDAGDRCLMAVAGALRDGCRAADLIARYGGEEFVVVAEGLSEAAAVARAEALRAAIERLRIDLGAHAVTVTVSIGVAVAHGAETPAATLIRADIALYEAKRNGRNRVAPAVEPLVTPRAARIESEMRHAT